MYAVIETGGKQYRVELGNEIEVDRLDVEPGQTIRLERVLLVADGDDATIGRPIVEGALVNADVVRQDRGDKIIVFKYKPKARRRVKKGHRQDLTVLRIAEIALGDRSAARDAAVVAAERQAEREAAESAAAARAAADKQLAAKLAASDAAAAKKSGSAKTAAGSAKSGGGTAKTAGSAKTASKPAATKSKTAEKPATTKTAASRTQAGEAKGTKAAASGSKATVTGKTSAAAKGAAEPAEPSGENETAAEPTTQKDE